MGQGALSKPAVQWWLSLCSSTPTQSELAGLSCLSSRRRCRRARGVKSKFTRAWPGGCGTWQPEADARKVEFWCETKNGAL